MDQILIMSLLAGLATIIGCLIVFAIGIPSRQFMAGYLGLAAGIMAILVVDLLSHALQIEGSWFVLRGILVGILFMVIISYGVDMLANQGIRKRRMGKKNTGQNNSEFVKIGWTMVLGIAMHNIPEGLAIAAGEAANHQLGLALIFAIALHNIPEGIGVTAPLLKSRTGKLSIITLLLLVSLCVPLGTWIGTHWIEPTDTMIATSLGFAAGAMVYIVAFHLLPSAFRQSPIYAQFGIFLGVLILSIAH
ncbi:hypothetical protein BHU72_04895 [Desulfuribacillus stibiiarsenatis]|uniref:Zinc permease n=1 Tax=Desulfuribacillus stibiiarsenatis TaxID=1390249 RepID=A0A1E5L5N3_9FIRM|nr:ZIP family metal transporter [Desulfuribacillus stibiiarsenatis]OEH85430.1 hypothetical protein BHU72_04895 [Desulfuribacillus stibiiarsenatis]